MDEAHSDPVTGPLSIVWCSCPVQESARLAKTLVEERLAACVNISGPTRSFYYWEGKLCEQEEVRLMIKTLPERVMALTKRLEALHSYDTPEILVVEGTCNSAYEAWVRGAVSHHA